MSETVLSRIADALFPPLCPITGEHLSGVGTLSPEAWRDLALFSGPARCRSCGAEIPGAAPAPDLRCEACHAAPRAWDRGAAAMRYEGTGRDLVLALKRGDRLDLVPMLAGLMARAGRPLLAEADLVVPVPLHWRRRLARRFNQSAELARALCRLAGRRAAYAPRLLRRIRHTPSQGGLRAEARAANIAGAFALAPGAEARLAGRRVLLVDDVLTTGATLSACTETLRAGGARAVDILVCALVRGEDRPYLPAVETSEEREDGQSRDLHLPPVRLLPPGEAAPGRQGHRL